MTTDRRSGLDLDLGGRCSAIAYGWTRRTFAAREGRDGAVSTRLNASFSSLVELGGRQVGITSDGVGTKVELAERTGAYGTLGYDLVAMVADDLAANGFEPTNLTNILDVDRLDERVVDELMRGLAQAAGAAGIALAGGEIAELGARVGGWGEGMHFNWCATAIGVLAPGLTRPIDGSSCAPGDAVVAIGEKGLRSNGFSWARMVLAATLGERWHESRCAADGRTWGEALLTPSIVCCPLVTALAAKGLVPHGIAHVTGGGIPDKLGRVLKVHGLGARIDRPFSAPPFMAELQRLARAPASQVWRQWNMGHAMLLVVGAEDASRVVSLAEGAGFGAQVAGTIEAEPVIRIRDGQEEVAFPVR
ncbi:MAG: phosphoribosylformylglycinamidine cyclo-ligase [Deltaproteobacteria bacterium]|nr:phosphoribosylformylglycinamidine cyclo-ligase [Deltaproteobacteria bacterium]